MVEKKEQLSQGEKIYVMSDYLKKSKGPKAHPSFTVSGKNTKKKSFPLWLIWIFFGFIIIVFAAVFYFYPNFVISLLGGEVGQNNQQSTENSQPVINNSPSENLERELFIEKTLKTELKEGDNIIVGAELFLPENSFQVGEEVTLESRFVINEKNNDYQVIGGLFETFPLVIPKQKLILKIFYSQDQVDLTWEEDLKIGYWQENAWMVLPGQVDVTNNKITTELVSLYSGIFAIIIPNEKTSNQEVGREIAPGVFAGRDQDADDLTDEEEELFLTDKNNPDTDNDSANDGLEINNLYSPISGYGVKLIDTNLVKVFNNETFQYSLFYPSSFLPRVIKGSNDSEVIISGDGGEFFGIVVQDNHEVLAVKEWYQQQIDGSSEQELKEVFLGGYPAVWSLDGLTVYIGKNDKIYALTHNIGGAKVANLRTTFLMILKSFEFIK